MLCIVFLVFLVCGYAANAQQAPDAFRWIDFHAPADQDVVTWVTRTLDAEKWSAIREIGVEYDAALVVTTLRASSKTAATSDTFTIWTVSLSQHRAAILLRGTNLRWLDWMRFADSAPMEPAMLYDSCANCASDTYFTSFHYDMSQHGWTPRWMRGNQTAPIWSAAPPPGVTLSQVYAGLAEGNGREFIATWNHFDYGNAKKPEDYVFRYDVDTFSGLERMLALTGKDAEALRQRICLAQGAVVGLTRGQDGAICQPYTLPGTPSPVPAYGRRHREHKPSTTSPASSQGQSQPTGKPR
jgi:hypothetical protein